MLIEFELYRYVLPPRTNLKAVAYTSIQQQISTSVQWKTCESGLSSLFSIPPSDMENNLADEQQQLKLKKQEKKKRKIS